MQIQTVFIPQAKQTERQQILEATDRFLSISTNSVERVPMGRSSQYLPVSRWKLED